jgi:hypothetical protein
MHQLVAIQNAFQQCFRDIAVFERFRSDGQFFEVNDFQKENKRWLVIAAGIEKTEAVELFRGNPKRAQRSLIPLKYRDRCRISLLFLIRPFNEDPKYENQTVLVSPFAPDRGIPYVEIRIAYIRIYDIPENDNRLLNLRWEWDALSALKDPIEKWLKSWMSDCGFNPAHPPSHLHLNSEEFSSSGKGAVRTGDFERELRLAIGRPNPLAFLLSVGAWFRGLRYSS